MRSPTGSPRRVGSSSGVTGSWRPSRGYGTTGSYASRSGVIKVHVTMPTPLVVASRAESGSHLLRAERPMVRRNSRVWCQATESQDLRA